MQLAPALVLPEPQRAVLHTGRGQCPQGRALLQARRLPPGRGTVTLGQPGRPSHPAGLCSEKVTQGIPKNKRPHTTKWARDARPPDVTGQAALRQGCTHAHAGTSVTRHSHNETCAAAVGTEPRPHQGSEQRSSANCLTEVTMLLQRQQQPSEWTPCTPPPALHTHTQTPEYAVTGREPGPTSSDMQKTSTT